MVIFLFEQWHLGSISCNHNMSESEMFVCLLQHFQGLWMFLVLFYFCPLL